MTIKWTKKDVIKAFSEAMDGGVGQTDGTQPASPLAARLKELANVRMTGKSAPRLTIGGFPTGEVNK